MIHFDFDDRYADENVQLRGDNAVLQVKLADIAARFAELADEAGKIADENASLRQQITDILTTRAEDERKPAAERLKEFVAAGGMNTSRLTRIRTQQAAAYAEQKTLANRAATEDTAAEFMQ